MKQTAKIYRTRYIIHTDTLPSLQRMYELSGYTPSELQHPVEWPLCSEHLHTVSREYPRELLTVYGIGHHTDDVWVRYAFCGMLERHTIMFHVPRPSLGMQFFMETKGYHFQACELDETVRHSLRLE
jgi:hypothetical protein